MRSVVVLLAVICGGIVGLAVGLIVADATIPIEPQTDLLPNFDRSIVAMAGAILGALVGGLAVGVFLLARRLGKRET